MASELSTTTITENNENNNKVHQFVSEVEAHKRILETSTNLFTTLSVHYSSLLNSLSEKSKSIDSKLQSLQFNSTETLDSLLQDENSIPERESAAVVLIEQQKEAALAELQKPIPGNIDISAVLKSICRRMDSTALVRFIVSKRKESALLRSKISTALAEAVDAPKLVLEALEDFLNSKSVRSGATDKRWACGILIQAMVPESGTKGVRFSRRIAERALRVVERWKEQMDGESGSAAEAVMFLQMVMCFGLRNRFDEEYLRKSVMQFPSRRDMAKLAATLEFGDKMIDIIDELVKNGKEVEAVYFASESGLTERFPPVDLLKSFIRNCRKNTSALLKKGNNRQDDTYTELNSTKALIKCVEDFKLESEINLDSLRRRITQLEKNMGDRRKSSASGSKPPYKQAYGSGRKRGCRGSGSSRPEKSAKYSSYPSSSPSSFSRRNMAPSLQPSPATRYSAPYNYPSQTIYDGTIYDGSTANPYAATYGTSHIQTPAGLQQHYSVPVDNLASSAYPSTSSYATGQTGYGGMYDYGNAVPPSYPNQNSYMG